ncbi:thiamine pyrophosphate-binding protein [Thermohalobacter berrensis]|uniref:Acetolactate synthase n=1 Tax=Thermohalobacter berrensis TaxID=99594 RepID=A0A419TB01_9FIRM|nr:thiamine pyrophosphate-binding protein [Thermohalobacter berrensis]RKD34668.1 hypothetical protein BET03_02245 [Thermohalobacter berrensis]
MRIADAILLYLYKNGVRHAFGIPTGQLSGFNDALNDIDIDYIVVKNEAAATYSAGRYADLKRDLGVCLIGGCVGVNNAINGIADAYRNKLPVLIVSSYVKRESMNKNALQEMITTDITTPITKYSKTVFEPDNVMEEFEKALKIALTPPHGPVHLSIPTDVQLTKFKGIIPDRIDRDKLKPKFDDKSLKKATNTINNKNTGVIMVGRGARGLTEEIKKLSSTLKWPTITTPNAKGLISSKFEYNLGNYGWCTTDGAAEYIDNTDFDCLLVLGSSLGQMSTRAYKKTLVENKTVIHIDWDKNEFNKVFKTDIPVYYDLEAAIKKINKNIHPKNNVFYKPDINKPYTKNHTGLSLRIFMEKIVDIVPEDTCFVQDMGENMNFSFKYLPLKEKMDFQTSIHYASMGTAIAGVMGSYLANPNRQYAVLVGDGSFYMNGMELLTAKEHNMPIIYFVVNNSMFGLVEHAGKLVYGRSHKGKSIFSRVSIKDMAESMGIESVKISHIKQLGEIKEKIHNLDKPFVVELITDGSEILLDKDRWSNKV